MKKIWEEQRIFVIGFLGLLLIGGWFLWSRPEEPTEKLQFSSQKTEISTSESQNSQWFVDVKGAVEKAGMYPITSGMRLMDVVDLAGGFTAEADQNQVNFSKLLMDQEVVYIPKVGETIPSLEKNVAAGEAAEDSKVNLNTADATELQTLSGIGEKKAQDIISYRETNGSFQTVEDLLNVSGIGDKTLENLREMITVE